jgi:hypothetical protein
VKLVDVRDRSPLEELLVDELGTQKKENGILFPLAALVLP